MEFATGAVHTPTPIYRIEVYDRETRRSHLTIQVHDGEQAAMFVYSSLKRNFLAVPPNANIDIYKVSSREEYIIPSE